MDETFRLEELAPRIRAAGHTIEWGFDGPVSTNAPGDPGWWCRIDGELVATGGAIGELEKELGAVLMKVVGDGRFL